ncbi:MAG: Abi family protein [Oribacterium sp.]|nr:Abi family protein [Oribacterium sp.]
MSKPYLTIEQQLKVLEDNKGLIISDKSYAREMLTDIGYFSLIGGYKRSFINPMTRKYEVLTTFEDILSLYRFDEALRQLTFGYLNRIEQKIQNLVADSFCSSYGEKQSFYLNPSSYSTTNQAYAKAINKLISILSNIANNNTDHEYLIHQRNTYGNVPLWVTTHAMTFGQLSNMYSFLNPREKSKVSKNYSHISEKELEQYLSALTLFRNTCAHKERLFSFRLHKRNFPDTVLHAKMNIPKKGNQYTQGKADYFGLVIAFRYLLSRADFLAFKSSLKKLIDSYCRKNLRLSKNVLLKEMGIPLDWEKITRYRI